MGRCCRLQLETACAVRSHPCGPTKCIRPDSKARASLPMTDRPTLRCPFPDSQIQCYSLQRPGSFAVAIARRPSSTTVFGGVDRAVGKHALRHELTSFNACGRGGNGQSQVSFCHFIILCIRSCCPSVSTGENRRLFMDLMASVPRTTRI